jgi:hypothetical protein
MKRREFILALGGATAWPLAVRAQQPDRVRLIGMLIAVAESDPVGQRNAAIFRQSLQSWAGRRDAASILSGAGLAEMWFARVTMRRSWSV